MKKYIAMIIAAMFAFATVPAVAKEVGTPAPAGVVVKKHKAHKKHVVKHKKHVKHHAKKPAAKK